MTTGTAAPARGVPCIAAAAGGGFAAFYSFYSAAPVVLGSTGPSAGTRVAVVMIVVVAVQALVLLAGRWLRNRRRAVLAALVSMGFGIATLRLGEHWPGSVFLGLGFGIFVVMSTAWVKEHAPPGHVGHALGIYGFGSAIGGAIGAPVGLFLAHAAGLTGVVIAGSAFAGCALLPAWSTGSGSAADAANPGTTAMIVGEDGPSPVSGTGTVIILLTGHLLAVSVYAAVLSSAGSARESSMAWVTVLVAFLIQVSLALGRLACGFVSDRWPSGRTVIAALVLLFLGAAGFVLSSVAVGVIAASVLVGFASGAGQTAALTAMMRLAQGPAGIERVSSVWNIGFDLGLGTGAFLAGRVTLR